MTIRDRLKEPHLTAYSMNYLAQMEKHIPQLCPQMVRDLQAWNRNLEQIWSRCRVSGQVMNIILLIFRCLSRILLLLCKDY